MGGTTGTYALRYPSQTDAPDGATQIQDLAEDVDGALAGVASPTAQTFTPAWSNIGSAVFDINTGWYYKIGKLVFVCIYAHVATAGSGTTALTVSLPSAPYRTSRQVLSFNADGIRGTGSSVNGYAVIFSTAEGFSGALVDRLRGSSNAATNIDTNVTGADLSVNGRLTVQGWYREA